METIQPLWCVWYVSQSNKLLHVEHKGALLDCVRFVEPRLHGAYAILPYDPLD